MPLYRFKCYECNETDEDNCMFRNKQYPVCSRCDTVMVDDFTPVKGAVFGDKERISTALGVHPSQIADGSVFKIHPGAVFNKRGDMVMKNRSEQKQRLRERNWVNKDSYC